MAQVITFANFKGGTGKTTNSTSVAYELSKKGYRVLLADFDPQGNATSMFLKTRFNNLGEEFQFDETLMMALQKGDLSSVVTKIKENLYLLPSYRDLKLYPDFLEESIADKTTRAKYLSAVLDSIREEFDFIFIDVPPTFSIFTNSALYASDHVVIVAQAHEYAINGVEDFLEDAQEFVDKYEKQFSILGILPVILKPNSLIDKMALKQARELFGEENMFDTTINQMERLRRWGVTGITDDTKDINDRKVHERYERLSDEMLKRLELNLEVSANE